MTAEQWAMIAALAAVIVCPLLLCAWDDRRGGRR